MKKIFNRILALMFLIVSLSSCTHNNGDIGDYFGMWKLETITIDGEKDSEYEGNVFWRFQNEVIGMTRVNEEMHASSGSYGTWKELEGDVLQLNFTHSDNYNPAGSFYYSPLPETYLPVGISNLDILSQSGSEMKLRYMDVDGRQIDYKFKKW